MRRRGGAGVLSGCELCCCPWLAILLMVVVYPASRKGHCIRDGLALALLSLACCVELVVVVVVVACTGLMY